MRYILAVVIGKLISFLLIKFGGGATALPGLIALYVDPNFLKRSLVQCKERIYISGTNGKTTTGRLISSVLRAANIDYISNRAGSNLLRGVASAFLIKTSLLGKVPYTTAIFEVDEAALTQLISIFPPSILVILNLSRDQLDRYGEVDTIRKKWQASIKEHSNISLVLNADEPLIASLGDGHGGKVIWFGTYNSKYSNSQVSAQAVEVWGLIGSTFTIKSPAGNTKLILPLPGLYNVYNALAAISAAILLNIDLATLSNGLQQVTAAFGRVETLTIAEKQITILLMKNPASVNALTALIATHGKSHFLILLNDLIADGRDVSWIWDADFERLVPRLQRVTVGGTRAHDLDLRLKYAGIKEPVLIQPTIKSAFEQALRHTPSYGELIVIPTYTALLELRKILAKKGLGISHLKEKN